ncbi:ureidoglycolate lyase [Pseudomonas typographi]|uniref:Ureidoglycolate hydrolase n=1 Tax=Pseudomonas typographi TaxID=2715964 RepID=A0ABR7Z0V5_9PSED|nr:hypothetical protein [Pseudomonas typographi]MBD1599067.1 hypothetical protein [Pseudomonas typographi]
MVDIFTEPLTQEAFASYGRVLESPRTAARHYFDDELQSQRSHALPSLSLVRNEPVHGETLTFDSLECHRYSSQSFVPMSSQRWLVVVAPDVDERPDISGARAFVATPDQGITFFPGTWHLGLHVLDGPATHAIFMWRDLTADDETFADVDPTTLRLPGLSEVQQHE